MFNACRQQYIFSDLDVVSLLHNNIKTVLNKTNHPTNTQNFEQSSTKITCTWYITELVPSIYRIYLYRSIPFRLEETSQYHLGWRRPVYTILFGEDRSKPSPLEATGLYHLFWRRQVYTISV